MEGDEQVSGQQQAANEVGQVAAGSAVTGDASKAGSASEAAEPENINIPEPVKEQIREIVRAEISKIAPRLRRHGIEIEEVSVSAPEPAAEEAKPEEVKAPEPQA